MMPWETITAAAQAVSKVCDVMLSPAGQTLMQQWAKDGDKLRADLSRAGEWLRGLFARGVR